jgi:hypothetical protein
MSSFRTEGEAMSKGSSDSGDVEDATKAEEAREAGAAHAADRPPTPEEEAAAEGKNVDPDVAAHEREMGKIGADLKGEGEID